MFFKQFYLECLAHASYLICSGGQAVVIDPQRDVDQYIDDAEAQGANIRFILETHLHADFVSGHRELAERTGAEVVFGEKAGAEFPHRAVRDGDELSIGGVTFHAIETPGHTPEGISWLLTDGDSGIGPQKLFTGDTLFIGDVGRPDLAGSRGYTSEQMASLLYDSLHEKILCLDDSVEVWPAHGAGSSCGRNISKETRSTIGEQRRMNYALAPMSREEFVRMMTSDLPPAPRYFPRDAEMNRRGAVPVSSLRAQPLSPTQVEAAAARGAQIVDVRRLAPFGQSHLPSSINIGLRGQFAPWSGALLDPAIPIILVAESEADAKEAVMRLARVGLENVAGFLEGGVEAWHDAGLPLTFLSQISVGALRERLEQGDSLQIVDVRATAEYESGHIPRAFSSPLALFPGQLPILDRTVPIAVVCEGGYRSSAAASLLQRSGFSNLMNVSGGTAAWLAAGYDVES